MWDEGIMSNANNTRKAYRAEAQTERMLQSRGPYSERRKPGKRRALSECIRLAQVSQSEGYWYLSNAFLNEALIHGLRRGERDEVRRSIANNMKQARLDLARGA